MHVPLFSGQFFTNLSSFPYSRESSQSQDPTSHSQRFILITIVLSKRAETRLQNSRQFLATKTFFDHRKPRRHSNAEAMLLMTDSNVWFHMCTSTLLPCMLWHVKFGSMSASNTITPPLDLQTPKFVLTQQIQSKPCLHLSHYAEGCLEALASIKQ